MGIFFMGTYSKCFTIMGMEPTPTRYKNPPVNILTPWSFLHMEKPKIAGCARPNSVDHSSHFFIFFPCSLTGWRAHPATRLASSGRNLEEIMPTPGAFGVRHMHIIHIHSRCNWGYSWESVFHLSLTLRMYKHARSMDGWMIGSFAHGPSDEKWEASPEQCRFFESKNGFPPLWILCRYLIQAFAWHIFFIVPDCISIHIT